MRYLKACGISSVWKIHYSEAKYMALLAVESFKISRSLFFSSPIQEFLFCPRNATLTHMSKTGELQVTEAGAESLVWPQHSYLCSPAHVPGSFWHKILIPITTNPQALSHKYATSTQPHLQLSQARRTPIRERESDAKPMPEAHVSTPLELGSVFKYNKEPDGYWSDSQTCSHQW